MLRGGGPGAVQRWWSVGAEVRSGLCVWMLVWVSMGTTGSPQIAEPVQFAEYVCVCVCCNCRPGLHATFFVNRPTFFFEPPPPPANPCVLGLGVGVMGNAGQCSRSAHGL